MPLQASVPAWAWGSRGTGNRDSGTPGQACSTRLEGAAEHWPHGGPGARGASGSLNFHICVFPREQGSPLRPCTGQGVGATHETG